MSLQISFLSADNPSLVLSQGYGTHPGFQQGSVLKGLNEFRFFCHVSIQSGAGFAVWWHWGAAAQQLHEAQDLCEVEMNPTEPA